jgi:plasmid stabilization system protein ParE
LKVHWTDTAIRRLKELHNYIAQDAPQLAGSVTLRLLQRSRQLETAGRSGRKVPEYDNDEVRELLERP